MNYKDIPQERIQGYLEEFMSRLPSLYAPTRIAEDCMFWSYVAGREHGKEIVEPVKPVKAEWNLYREGRSMSGMAFQSIWFALYPQGKPAHENK